jgi:uncharacterized protein (DUF433 family)
MRGDLGQKQLHAQIRYHRSKSAKSIMQTITDIGTMIVQTPGICGGRPCIADHRLTVHTIVIDFNAGMKPEDILEERPQLSLAKIYAALTYYFAN